MYPNLSKSHRDIPKPIGIIIFGICNLLSSSNHLLASLAKRLSTSLFGDNQAKHPCEKHPLYGTMVALLSGVITAILSIYLRWSVFLDFTVMVEKVAISQEIKILLTAMLLTLCLAFVVFMFQFVRHCLHRTKAFWWSNF